MFQDQGINTTFIPFFQENGEKWLMTTPYFQVALNCDLTKDETRRKKAMEVLSTMLSEDAQNRIISEGQDMLSYSQDVDMQLTEYLKDVKSVIEENHMYIRIASNDFFSISKDVVSKMLSGEYDAEQAYQSFNSQLLEEKATSENVVLNSQKSYSNRFHSSDEPLCRGGPRGSAGHPGGGLCHQGLRHRGIETLRNRTRCRPPAISNS